MTATGLPFDDVRDLLGRLPAPDEAAAARMRAALEADAETPGELGRLAGMAVWLAATTGRVPSRVSRPLVAVFAGTHAVSGRLGVDDAIARTRARVDRLASGEVPVSRLCRAGDLGLKVFDLALELPVADITADAALDERGCAATMAFGMEAIAGGTDLLCLGDLGVSNAVPAAAIFAALFGEPAEAWVEDARARMVVAEALSFHAGALGDPLEVLRRLGGREIAAVAGAILAARQERVPVVLDGVATTAAAAVLHAVSPAALDHCLLAGVADDVHRHVAERIGLTPLLELGLRVGEATGAALAAGLVRDAAGIAAGIDGGGTRSA